jgi:hypothetical protein
MSSWVLGTHPNPMLSDAADRFGLKVRPPIVCMDGATISVQASKFHFCSPRNNDGPYSSVEVGFPTPDFPEGAPWKENPDKPDSESVFALVPIQVVSDWIESHGGYSHVQVK